jgi:protein-tyrosine phosphatase
VKDVGMRCALYVVNTPAAGRLATMAHPRGGDWLADELTGLADAGVDLLVSALTDGEMRQLELVREADEARAAGLAFVRYPIPDISLPPDLPAELELSARLAEQVRAGRFVVAHCWAGIGRSSMIVGTVLVQLGLTPQQAWAAIREARGLQVPDVAAQEQWLHDFADAVAANRTTP